MSKHAPGGPAFPRASYRHIDGFDKAQDGMTLRDYFASKAMQGLIADGHTMFESPRFQGDMTAVAQFAYEMADVMLKAREGRT